MSSDGNVLLGNIRTADRLHDAGMRWTQASGWTRLGAFPGHADSAAVAVSADGSIVLGWSGTSGSGVGEAFRSTSSGIQGLGNLPGEPGCAPLGQTNDLGVVVGECATKTFRWTMADGTTPIPTLPGYTANRFGRLSRDGSVVVGASENDAGKSQAFRWTKTTGTVGLGFLPGFDESVIYRGSETLSADGKVVTGQVLRRSPTSSAQAFRWSESSGLVGLAFLPGDNTNSVRAVSADGSIIAGSSQFRDPNGGAPQSHAVTWDDKGTAHSVGDELEAAGVDLAGHQLSDAYVIVRNGRVILYGSAEGPEGRRAWVAWIP
jgi:probable HAF family extracellular repeat protein